MPLTLAQKDNQKKNRKLQKTPRYDVFSSRIHRGQGKEEHNANHSGLSGDLAAGLGRQGEGASVRITEAGIGRKESLDGRTLGQTVNWAQVKKGKGG